MPCLNINNYYLALNSSLSLEQRIDSGRKWSGIANEKGEGERRQRGMRKGIGGAPDFLLPWTREIDSHLPERRDNELRGGRRNTARSAFGQSREPRGRGGARFFSVQVLPNGPERCTPQSPM